MEDMCSVLIRLANTPPPKSQILSSNEPIRKLRNLNFVHCPTLKLPLSVGGDYSSSIKSIVKWKSDVKNPGGINAPKKIEVVCSDGKSYPQLLKGKDDLRQDAVMQQVFNIMNALLRSSNKTKKDRLNIRTYIVVPLSQRSGILEWCINTIPLNEYLSKAHQRYNPKDLPPAECRKKLVVRSIQVLVSHLALTMVSIFSRLVLKNHLLNS